VKPAALLAALLLSSCCTSPIWDTARKVADRDLTQRADAALMSCAIGEEYVMRVKIVRSEL